MFSKVLIVIGLLCEISAKDIVSNTFPQDASDGNLRKWGMDEKIRLQNVLL